MTPPKRCPAFNSRRFITSNPDRVEAAEVPAFPLATRSTLGATLYPSGEGRLAKAG